jgi:hypothetical protein
LSRPEVAPLSTPGRQATVDHAKLGALRTGAPAYGQHTREVLLEHGLTGADIDAFAAKGAIIVVERSYGGWRKIRRKDATQHQGRLHACLGALTRSGDGRKHHQCGGYRHPRAP